MDRNSKIELAHLIQGAFIERERSLDPVTKKYKLDLDEAVAKTCRSDPDLIMVVRLCLQYSEGLEWANKTLGVTNTKKTAR